MGLSQQHQQRKCVVVGHWKACNNRGIVRQDWMVLSCVTSPSSLGLLRPTCVCTCMLTCTEGHEPQSTKKYIVNRKHAGLTRDWEVILDRWPLVVLRFCFTLKLLGKASTAAPWLLPCKESWETGTERLPLLGVLFVFAVFFVWFFFSSDFFGEGELSKKI